MYPRLKLDIVGTDAALDLKAGEADVAIRYAMKPPRDDPYVELVHDKFYVVAVTLTPTEFVQYPLIKAEWPPTDPHAPNWRRWQRAARTRHKTVPALAALASVTFREELHAIEAAIAGQGVAICSNVLFGPEIASGALVPISRITLRGYGFYILHRAGHPKDASIRAFVAWARAVA